MPPLCLALIESTRKNRIRPAWIREPVGGLVERGGVRMPLGIGAVDG
jgi:hypothetical protein